ncbi:MAG: hypothetical protein JXB29_03715 [Sedimentisphaerales bacterium]|nr:hypothetical protein [Sedimentisphaerales bacterium]
MIRQKLPIEQYLEKAAGFVGDRFGSMIRHQFKDNKGSSELAMLVAPTESELEQWQRAVAIMTPLEKENAADLTDEQVQRIAADARIDPANLAIFINGYTLYRKRVS